eukprot:146736_1
MTTTTTPTFSPTDIPTSSPSNAPSNSPTACPDYDKHFPSNDGNDTLYNFKLDISKFFPLHINMANNDLTKVDSHTNIGVDNQATCINDTDICIIQCIDDRSCWDSYLLAMNVNLKTLNISCDAKRSCYGVTVEVSNADVDSIYLHCGATASCAFMRIHIDHISSNSIFIQCSNTKSCQSMQISITSHGLNAKISQFHLICYSENSCGNIILKSSEANIANMSIVCIEPYSCNSTYINNNAVYAGYLSLNCAKSRSCDDISVWFNISKPIKYYPTIICYNDYSCNHLSLISVYESNINIIMYAYSDNVVIIHTKPDELNIQCGNTLDRRFIRYGIEESKNEDELIELARYEYDTHRLPCEDIHVDCRKSNSQTQSCVMKYKLNQLDFNQFIDSPCYWFELSELFSPICHGICDDIFLKIYNVSLPLDISIDKKNHSESELLSICIQHFGSINSTFETLLEIDRAIENILLFFSSDDPYKIYDILIINTALRDKLLEFECERSFDIVKIVTSIMIESALRNEDEFYAIFGDEFISRLQALLSKLFGIAIIVKSVINIDDSGFQTWHVVLIVAATILIVILIIYFAFTLYRKQVTIHIKNALVVAVAIGYYDENPIHPDIDGILNDLDGIDVDITNVAKLFKDKMNYDLHPAYDMNKTIRVYWTKQQLIDLLCENSTILANNIDMYDGLIVIISSHGMDKCILTSDYKTIPHVQIHRLFSAFNKGNTASRNIPRVYVFDCCRGSNERSQYDREMINGRKQDVEPENIIFEEKCNKIKTSNEINRQMSDPWAENENNPDHKLVVLSAANQDFQSKMSIRKGSYFVRSLVEKITENDDTCCCKNKLFLGDIVTKIQNELETSGKQLPECTYFNGTDKIIFRRNKITKFENNHYLEVDEEKPLNNDNDEIETELIELCKNSSNDRDKGNVVMSDNINNEGYIRKESMEDMINEMGRIVKMNQAINETQENVGETLENLGINIIK